jgi:hypothetical protein
MAVVGISEFTFGYAFLYEQTHNNWGNLRAAPILPSLQQEHDEGWDARLPVNGTDFYYQFKLSDYLSRGNASFIADGTYNGPYYRLALHKKDRNRQHRRLRELAQTNSHTYYVAPEFNNIDEFNAAFLQRQITQRSRMIAVSDCDDINDGDQHYLTFRQGRADWIQHSEKRRHQRSYSGEDLAGLYRQTHNLWKPVNKEFAEELFDKTAAVVRRVLGKEQQRAEPARVELLDFNPQQRERGDVLIRTSEILSVMLGVTLVVVGTAE